MDYTDDNVKVTATSMEEFSATKRAKRVELKQEKIRSRIWELDFLRGICVILMVFDHLMFDLAFVFGEEWFMATGNVIYQNIQVFAAGYWVSTLRNIVRPIVVLCFFVLCGISCSFSRSNLKRGILLLGFALIISAVTIAIDMPIYFGVLHMLAIAILTNATIRLFTRNNKWATAITCFAVGVICFVIEGILTAVQVPINDILAPLSVEFASVEFIRASADYFPILPNVGFVLVGASFAPILYPKRRTLLPCLDTQFRWYRPVNFVGRHAAIIYLLHQAVWAIVLGIYTIIAIPGGWDIAMGMLGIGG